MVQAIYSIQQGKWAESRGKDTSNRKRTYHIYSYLAVGESGLKILPSITKAGINAYSQTAGSAHHSQWYQRDIQRLWGFQAWQVVFQLSWTLYNWQGRSKCLVQLHCCLSKARSLLQWGPELPSMWPSVHQWMYSFELSNCQMMTQSMRGSSSGQDYLDLDSD